MGISPAKTWVNASAIPRQTNQVFKVIRWLVAYDSKPSTGRNRAGWVWGSWVPSQAELHIQTPLFPRARHGDSQLQPRQWGGREKKENCQEFVACLSYSGNSRPARATEYQPAPPPTPQIHKYEFISLHKLTTNNRCCKGNPGPCAVLHWTPPPVFPAPHRPKDLTTTHYTLFFCKGKVHWPDPPTGSIHRLTRGVDYSHSGQFKEATKSKDKI